MKIGSIVELVNDNWSKVPFPGLWNLPVRGKLYTVRALINHRKGPGIHLEEIVNRKVLVVPSYEWREPCFDIRKFRELLPPEALSEEIKEALEEPVNI